MSTYSNTSTLQDNQIYGHSVYVVFGQLVQKLRYSWVLQNRLQLDKQGLKIVYLLHCSMTSDIRDCIEIDNFIKLFIVFFCCD